MFEAVSTLLYIFGRLHSQHETLSTSELGSLRLYAGGRGIDPQTVRRSGRQRTVQVLLGQDFTAKLVLLASQITRHSQDDIDVYSCQ